MTLSPSRFDFTVTRLNQVKLSRKSTSSKFDSGANKSSQTFLTETTRVCFLRYARGMAVCYVRLLQSGDRPLTCFRTTRSRIGLMPPVNLNGLNLNSAMLYRTRQVQSSLQRKEDTISMSHMPVLGVSILYGFYRGESVLTCLSPSNAHCP